MKGKSDIDWFSLLRGEVCEREILFFSGRVEFCK